MSAEACAKAPESHVGPRSGLQRPPRRNPALDRVLWTATGITYRVGHPPRGPRIRRNNFALDLAEGIGHALMLTALLIIIGG